MVMYLSIIAAAYVTGLLLNGAFVTGYGLAAAYCAATIAALAFIDAAVALITRFSIPENKMNPFLRYFDVSRQKRQFYEKLGIRKWKDIIPESGKYLVGFAKDKIAEPDNNEYLLKFLRETCYAEIMHTLSLFLGFLTLIFLPYKLTIVLPAAVINAFLQLLPVLVQRYNRQRIEILYNYNIRKAKSNENS